MSSTQNTARSTLAALRRGDRAVAEVMVEETYAGIFAALVRMTGDRDLASDLTQETYARAWASLAGFDGRSQPGTWLYRIAYTTFLNHLRRPRPWGPSLDEEGAAKPPDPRPSPEALLSARLDAGRVRRAVLGLPEDLRFAVGARYWGEVRVAEIARNEGVSEVTIRKRLRRALDVLRRGLEERA